MMARVEDVAAVGAVFAIPIGACALSLLEMLKPGLRVSFANFEVRKLSGLTTERRATGEKADAFLFYPLITVTPDVTGNFRVEWNWVNTLDGNPFGRSIPTIVNDFPGLAAGVPVTLRLVDNRDPATTGRDPYWEGSIGVGDKNLPRDGIWHTFHSDVTARVISVTTGAYVDVAGALTEDFRSYGVLSAKWEKWELKKK